MLSSLNAPILLPPKEKLNTIISCHQQLLLLSVAQWPQSLNHTTSLLSPQTEGATVSWIQRLLLKRLAWLLGFFLSGLDSALHIRRRTKNKKKKHWQHFLWTSFGFGRHVTVHTAETSGQPRGGRVQLTMSLAPKRKTWVVTAWLHSLTNYIIMT